MSEAYEMVDALKDLDDLEVEVAQLKARAEKAEANVARLTSLLEHIADAPPGIPDYAIRDLARDHAKWRGNAAAIPKP